MKYVGCVTDEAWAKYYFDRGIQIIVSWGSQKAKEYQKKFRFHDDNTSEIADQILAEHLGLTKVKGQNEQKHNRKF